jgi:adenylate kinase family enzyme
MSDHASKALAEASLPGEPRMHDARSPPAVQPVPLQSQNPKPTQQQLVGNKRASRIHITGASGSGVSTLGTNLASALSFPVFDVDAYYWLPTNPPFTIKRPIHERISLLRPNLRHAQEENGGWVLSGSMDSWGDEIMEDVEHVIFVDTATDVRMKRLREREFMRHGERIQEGGDMHEESVKFLAWAEAYEDPGLEVGRSRVRHEQWLRGVRVPVTRLLGDQDELVVMKEALKALKRDDEKGREEDGW